MDDGPADRDVIDVAAAGSDDRDRVRRIVIARCGDALTEEEIADIFEPDPSAAIWIEIGERVLDAVDALGERLTGIEQAVREK